MVSISYNSPQWTGIDSNELGVVEGWEYGQVTIVIRRWDDLYTCHVHVMSSLSKLFVFGPSSSSYRCSFFSIVSFILAATFTTPSKLSTILSKYVASS